jgi:cyclopropane fatty-acyl-phospholipid synthase-like methyltransferase
VEFSTGYEVSYRELVIGAGNRIQKIVFPADKFEFEDVTTLDIDPDCKPDVLWDLNVRPLPFEDNTFDEIHAYEVLEHLGKQGDYKGFFEEFGEYWRILKPGGYLIASTPVTEMHRWGDPGHTRHINESTLSFLSQKIYNTGVGKTAMTDYRSIWKKDFDIVHIERLGESVYWSLQKV